MVEKITCEDIDLEVIYGKSFYVMIDVFKFIKEEGSGYIRVEIEDRGDYKYLDEIVDEFEITENEELRKRAIKWLFEKVSIEWEGARC